MGGTEPRNLVICCDGTGNVLGNQYDTNVVKLARLCVNDATQLVFYDPGVGTASGLPSVDLLEGVQSTLGMISGMAFGRGVYENISQAYEFLVENYRKGDRIFLFGFSRGAFTVRCVSGLVTEYGIVRPSSLPLLPLMVRNFFVPHDQGTEQALVRHEAALRKPRMQKPEAENNRRTFNQDVRDHFADQDGRDAEIHFIGVWDTVASVGGVRPMEFATRLSVLKGKPYRHVRHAVSDGEYRAKYSPRLYVGQTRAEPRGEGKEREPSFKQLWFPGVHSDVGGSYKEAGLSDGALAWMLAELAELGDHGLRLMPNAEQQRDWPRDPQPLSIAHDQALVSPLWALTGLQRRMPPTAAEQHESLRLRIDRPDLDVEQRLRFPRMKFFNRSLAACIITFAVLALNARVFVPALLTPFDLAVRCANALLTRTAPALPSEYGFGWLFAANAAFVLAFEFLACTLVVFGVRALRRYHPGNVKLHDGFRRLTLFGLWVALAGGWLESWFGYAFFSQPKAAWGVAQTSYGLLLGLTSAARWIGVCALLYFWLFAVAIRSFGRGRAGEVAPAPAPAE